MKTIADAPSGADTLLASERRADGPSIATQLGELAHDSARASQQAAALHVIAAVRKPAFWTQAGHMTHAGPRLGTTLTDTGLVPL